MKCNAVFLGLVFGALFSVTLVANAAGTTPSSCLSPVSFASQIDASLLERKDTMRGYAPFTLDDVCVYTSLRKPPALGTGSCKSALAAAGDHHTRMLARDAGLKKLDKKLADNMPAFRRKTAELYAFWKPRVKAFLDELSRPNRFRVDTSPMQRLAELEQLLNRGEWAQRNVEFSIKLLRDRDRQDPPRIELCLYHERIGDSCARMAVDNIHLLSYEEFAADVLESERSSAIINDNSLFPHGAIPVQLDCLLKPKPAVENEDELAGVKDGGASPMLAQDIAAMPATEAQPAR